MPGPLSQRDKEILALIARSKDYLPGWKGVAEAHLPMVNKFRHPELINTRRSPSGKPLVRLSARGEIVCEYLTANTGLLYYIIEG